MRYYLTILGRRKKTPAVIRALYHREWYTAGMGNMRQWPEKLRRLMENEIVVVVIAITVAFGGKAVFEAVIDALVAWIWPKPEEVSLWLYLLIALLVAVLFSTILIAGFLAMDACLRSLKKHNADKDS